MRLTLAKCKCDVKSRPRIPVRPERVPVQSEPSFGDQQQERHKGRNVVERCFNRLKQWRGIAMRSDTLLRSYRAAVNLAATLIWITSD